MTNLLTYLRGPWAIAVYTWREGMRKKTLVGFLILSLLVIFGSNFVTAFLYESGGSEGPTSDVDTKLIKDICITAIAIFGILITIFISASVVPTEVENKVIYTVLSKPVRRFQYLFGKFVGVQLIVLLNLCLMGILFFFALYFKERVWPTLLLWSLLVTYFEFLIVSAFTFAVSCTASSSVLPTIAGLFIYITGYLCEYLKDTAERAGQTTQVLDALIGKIAYGLYFVLPNLKAFSRIEKQIVYAQPNDPVQAELIPQLILLSLVYCFAGYILAYWIFRRREL
ncbi:MAG TPA: ABC transporter permease subunit [Candidatus Hydrogenedentes bacterium]|nr:ABC transporter permease subunit [Candidatus Hydrogenedentota bacterium]HOL75769.1 ABC transporter permease subunit [Candidatus Hydrogenedentota bacterium]HPO84238.1 ABC transporter permease subunit [Candidatus Hydrogenedentota bacterium]